MTWDEASDASGIVGYSTWFSRTPGSEPPPVSSLVSRPMAAPLPSAGYEGSWYFSVRALDAAGNWGPAQTIEVRVSKTGFGVSRPTVKAVSKSRRNHAFWVNGTLNSSLARGQVTVTAYRLERGKWKRRLVRTTSIVPRDSASAAFRGRVSLKSGTWRVVVSHPDDGFCPPANSAASRTFKVR
jgi:hypothetical protein